ncbi:peroxisomal and mitochondrial division factor 1-like [Eutrema salsugineum]|uniref:peroxisomal and mitochondrial division factor 1-like n=1 Tax=Eutrema salsugineum TaxID=72664 RepID=UPI000CED1CFF|nr:peroxisomal and mitochondrial division factor 1-like [Eutrema salsugineum]
MSTAQKCPQLKTSKSSEVSWLTKKGERFESYEEGERLRKAKAEIEKRVRALERKCAVLEVREMKEKLELEGYKSEKKSMSKSQKKEMEKELKRNELYKKVEKAKNTLAMWNERIMEPTNGVHGDQNSSLEE